MGKQTAVAMTEEDEESFLAFLRESADVQLFVCFAPTKEALRAQHFVPTERKFLIWNKAFEWSPEYAQVTSGQRQGWYFIKNTGIAPVIEYSRDDFTGRPGQYGRIYWSKYFSAPDGLSYDVKEFEKWYGRAVRWIRKQGKKQSAEAYGTYYLPDAWTKHGNTP